MLIIELQVSQSDVDVSDLLRTIGELTDSCIDLTSRIPIKFDDVSKTSGELVSVSLTQSAIFLQRRGELKHHIENLE